MEETIDRSVDQALSQSESISQTQQRAQIQYGSDEFLDLILELKDELLEAINGLEELNNTLIVDYNNDPEGVIELMPKLVQLLHESEALTQSLSEGIVPNCLGTTIIANFKLEVGQLAETIAGINRKCTPVSDSLQSLYDQL